MLKRVLWALILIAVPLLLLSKWSVSHWGLVLLDGISDASAARTLLGNMTPEQIRGHIWFTTTIDLILPIAAAGLFASATLHSFVKYGRYLAIVPVLALPLDLTEGVIQVLALTGSADLLALKAYTTPVKSTCYAIGLMLSLAGLFWNLIVRVRRRASP
jgi:hypothetical protein